MSDHSSIEWTEATWNPVTGCTRVSPGCDHCYAEAFAERWRGVPGHPYEQGFDLKLWPARLDVPKRWRRPRLIFVNSMSDLFHVGVPEEFIQQVFRVMVDTPQHTYQILTKRADRLERMARRLPWPPNVWAGVSVEMQPYVSRIRHLQRVPAAVRFVSAEPLLGTLDLSELVTGLDWMILGGESGRSARPCELSWMRDLVHQCRAAGVAPFVKQLGSVWARQHHAADGKGRTPEGWPADLRIREMPSLKRRLAIA